MAFLSFLKFREFEIKFWGIQLTEKQIIGLKPHFFSGIDRLLSPSYALASKHRVWPLKHRLVRNIPETFKAWDYPNNLPFVPKRRCLLV